MHKNVMKILHFMLLVILSGCASVHYTHFAETENQSKEASGNGAGLIISAEEDRALSSTYFGVIKFTFENKSNDWIRVKNVAIDFENDILNREVIIPTGNDLKVWAKAVQQKKAIEDANSRAFLGTLVALGGLAVATSGNRSTQNFGGALYVTSATALAVGAVNEHLDALQKPGILPGTHLLSQGFSIPPGFFQRKWLLLFTKKPKEIPFVSTLFITYALEDGSTEKARVVFRWQPSRWQFGLKG